MSTQRAEPELERLLEKASRYWQARGARFTQVRRLICRCAFARIADAFDSERLLAAVRLQDKAVSPATVYRVLNDLVAAGLLATILGADGRRRYSVHDGSLPGHGHIICADCGGAFPLSDPCVALRSASALQGQGFRPLSLDLRIEAACEAHRSQDGCARRQDLPAQPAAPRASPPAQQLPS